MSVTAPRVALAGPRDAQVGLDLAKKGDCVHAVPLLEQAESAQHRPVTASALAQCQVVLGELIKARDLYKALAEEKPGRTWSQADKKAHDEAPAKQKALDDRIPTVEFSIEGKPPDGLSIQLGDATGDTSGGPMVEANEPVSVAPDEKISYTAKADGCDPISDTLLLHEGERRDITLEFKKKGSVKAPTPEPEDTDPVNSIGARFRGFLIPTFMMNIVADGGTTVFEPGAGVTYTRRFDRLELTTSLGYTYFGLPPTPFKPSGKPDTEWEIDEADLHSVALTLELFYAAPLDKNGVVKFRIGAGIGIGWMIAGDLTRTQAYPESGKPGDPYTYKKCVGPNNPAGTYRYCNSLDKDKTRYNEADKGWGNGGARPIIYPWVAAPDMGLSFWPSTHFGIDVDLGASFSGFFTGAGARYAF